MHIHHCDGDITRKRVWSQCANCSHRMWKKRKWIPAFQVVLVKDKHKNFKDSDTREECNVFVCWRFVLEWVRGLALLNFHFTFLLGFSRTGSMVSTRCYCRTVVTLASYSLLRNVAITLVYVSDSSLTLWHGWLRCDRTHLRSVPHDMMKNCRFWDFLGTLKTLKIGVFETFWPLFTADSQWLKWLKTLKNVKKGQK